MWPLVVARLAGMAVLLVVLLARRAAPWPGPAALGLTLSAGALDSLANLAFVHAAQRGSLALVSALVSLSPATAVLLGRFVLGERWSRAQRVGLVLALVSGALIAVG
jgi:drug/metabolite transporter (DMT)-like permease